MGERFFKEWAKPGSLIERSEGELSDASSDPEISCDGLSGDYRLFQLKKGHRFSTDDLLAGYYGCNHAPQSSRILDLGSGIGTIATLAAWRFQHAKVVSVEAQKESVTLARRSMAFNRLTDRVEVREGDFRDDVNFKPDEKFDLIFGSPPYFPLGSGILGDHPQKIACRFEERGDVFDYCKRAVRHLDFGGVFSIVFPVNPESQRERVLDAAQETGLSIIRSRDVIVREGELPLLGVFLMTRSCDLPQRVRAQTYVEPPLVIRKLNKEISSEYLAIKLSIGFPP